MNVGQGIVQKKVLVYVSGRKKYYTDFNIECIEIGSIIEKLNTNKNEKY
jgi:hypothetical protein